MTPTSPSTATKLTDALLALAERCEAAAGAGSYELEHEISVAIGRPANWHGSQLPAYTRSLDAAMTLIHEGGDWRRLTDKSVAVYAANPYNRTAQKRYDGYGATVALQMCAAALRARAAQ